MFAAHSRKRNNIRRSYIVAILPIKIVYRRTKDNSAAKKYYMCENKNSALKNENLFAFY